MGRQPEEYDAGISPLGGCCYRADLDGNFLVSSQNGNLTASDQFCDDVLYFCRVRFYAYGRLYGL